MTPTPLPERCIAFDGLTHIATGPLADVAPAVKRVLDRGDHGEVVVLDARTSAPVELDTRGTEADVARRYAAAVAAPPPPADEEPPATRGRGRPRLGVVAREVTLLPRHWDWLATQPGGASVALRKLVEEARRVNAGRDAARQARDIAYRFMSTVANPLPTLEEAIRALYAGDRKRFETLVGDWPPAMREHVTALAAPAFDVPAPAGPG